MSATERRLRRRRKIEKTFTSDSIDSDDQLDDGGKTAKNDDFQSASLSSDSGEHAITKGKPKRRLLRRTNDFQNLKPSTQIDDKDSKIASTKVKKSKKTNHLPQICDIEEEYEIIQTKMKNRKKHKQKVTTIIKEDTSTTTSKSDTDTSVPSESQLPSNGLENKQKTKHKNQRRRNRRGKRVQFSTTSCNNENESSVDTCASDVASNPSQLSDSKEVRNSNLDRKSTSDSDSIVYSFRNRKRALAESTVQNVISPKITPDKSDDSVEYNYKRNRGKAIQKSTELEEGKELAVEFSDKATETRQQTHLALSQAESTDSKITKSFGETFESKLVDQNAIIDFPMKETLNSIRKSTATINNRTVTETMIVTLNRPRSKNKSVQFQQDEPLNTLCEDINEKNNTYELDKSKNDISALKTVIVERDECVDDAADELNASSNLKHTELHEPPNAELSKEANPSNRRRTFELEESVTHVNVLKLLSGENTPLNDNGDSSFKDNFQMKTEKSSSGSNTTISRVTRRKKVELETNNVNLIDDISPPESSLLPSTMVDSSGEELPDCNKSIIKNLETTGSPSFLKQGRALSQSDQNLSSFGVSSTPLAKREGTYTLLNTRSTNKKMLSTSKETGQSSINKPSTRTKLPNFALIHKKAFEKMENIEQLQQRKAERAKLLLSGAKPAVGYNLQSPKKIRNQNILKPLNFGTESLKYSEVSESPKPLRNTVLHNAFLNSPKLSRPTHQSVNYSDVNKSPKPLYNSRNNVLNSPGITRSDRIFVNSPKATKSRVQSQKLANSPKVARSNLQSPKVKINTALLNKDINREPNKVKPTLLGKNMNAYGTSMNIHKPVIQGNGAKHIPTVPSTGITRYGFKTTSNPAKIITKQEQLKAVANKNNIIRNNVDERRNTIKGVRSNRRFELLMKMRNK